MADDWWSVDDWLFTGGWWLWLFRLLTGWSFVVNWRRWPALKEATVDHRHWTPFHNLTQSDNLTILQSYIIWYLSICICVQQIAIVTVSTIHNVNWSCWNDQMKIKWKGTSSARNTTGLPYHDSNFKRFRQTCSPSGMLSLKQK